MGALSDSSIWMSAPGAPGLASGADTPSDRHAASPHRWALKCHTGTSCLWDALSLRLRPTEYRGERRSSHLVHEALRSLLDKLNP
jgi:hypothetical protein